jgi:EmrB/QacA subfamily drug resistance transporter
MTNSKSSPRWVLALAATASFMIALDALVVSTALSTIRTDLGTSIGQLEWTVNAYLLSFAVLMMTAAALGDRLGRRRLFIAGLAIFAVASGACALAPDVGWLIGARAVQGAGAALVMPLGLALLSAAYPPQRRRGALAILSSVTGLSVICGPLVGGAVVQGISWPWVFWLNVPIALVVIVLARTRIDEGRGPDTTLDVPGLVLVTGAALGIVWALVSGNSAGWDSLQVLGSLAVGAVLGIAFVAWELRAGAPMLPLRLFRSRAFSAGNAAAFLWSASLLGTLFLVAQFLQNTLGYGPLGAGLLLMPWGVAVFAAPLFATRLVARFGDRRLVACGLALQAGGSIAIALIAEPGLPYWELVAPLVVAGGGFATAMPSIQGAVMGAVAPESIGRASGTLSTVRQLGSVFGVAIAAAVFAATGGYQSASSFNTGFVAAIAACAGLSLMGALAGLVLPAGGRVVSRA